MSVDKIRLACDWCQRAWLTADAANITDARVFASVHGWRIDSHKDVCTRCARPDRPAPVGAA